MVDPEIAAMLGLDDIDSHSDLRGYSPAAARARVAEGIAIAEADPPPAVSTRDLTIPGPAGPIGARLYTPGGAPAQSPGVVYVHGGGFMTCDLDTHDVFCRRIARTGAIPVVSVEYRLAPEHPYPAGAEDVLAAFRWVAENAASLGLDASRLAVAGDSGGGHYSALIARKARRDSHPPALQVPIYPALDATCSLPSHATLAEGWFLTRPMIDLYYGNYLGSDPARRKEPDASPLLAGDFEGVAPALVYSAGFDPLRDEAAAYAEALRSEGVPVEYRCFDSLVHGFVLMTGLSSTAERAAEQIAEDIGRALRHGVRAGAADRDTSTIT
jgi:acetyl esterase